MDLYSWVLVAILTGQPFPVDDRFSTIRECFDAGDRLTVVYANNYNERMKRFPGAKAADELVRIPKFSCVPIRLPYVDPGGIKLPDMPKPPPE
jgi:hypothetical protein